MIAASSDVRATILDALRQPLADAAVDVLALPTNFDLRANGVIDSLGFIQLIAVLEQRLSCSIDLADLDPAQLTNLDVLSLHIAARLPATPSSRNGWRDR